MKHVLKYTDFITQEKFINENINNGYTKWKRKNVTIRGMKELGKTNNVYGSYGKGLYTVPLSNVSMARKYGNIYFVVNAIPKNPKIFQYTNNAEIFIYNLIDKFCTKHDKEYDENFFEANTSIEKEMLELGYDGLIIKGREMVNYTPSNIKYFKTENELQNYYNDISIITEHKASTQIIKKQYLGQCDILRMISDENENKWQEMMRDKKEISFSHFIRNTTSYDFLDDEETIQDYLIRQTKVDDTTKTYISHWGGKNVYLYKHVDLKLYLFNILTYTI